MIKFLVFFLTSCFLSANQVNETLAKYQLQNNLGTLEFHQNNKFIELSKHQNFDLTQAQDILLKTGDKLLLLIWKNKLNSNFFVFEGFRFDSKLKKASIVAIPSIFTSGAMKPTINLNTSSVDFKYQIYSYIQDDKGVFHHLTYKVNPNNGKFILSKSQIDNAQTSHDLFNLAGFYLDHKKLKKSILNFELAFDENESDDVQIDKDLLAYLKYEYARALIINKQVIKAKPILKEIAKNYSAVRFGKDAAIKLKAIN